MNEQYRFIEKRMGNGDVRLEWAKGDKPHDPLDFWIVPTHEAEEAKERIRNGEFD